MPTFQGSFRLCRIVGIDLYLHWSWFLVAAFEIAYRAKGYSSLLWNALEYLALFGLVLLHEFGHALACRQVGGEANHIVLWPLGGVAYVRPPQRPGATLWSVAAGPLVNVALVPVFVGLIVLGRLGGWAQALPNVHALLWAIAAMNVVLLAFNLLPVYPLDGGQILRSLLWYPLGRARSLAVTAIIGFVGVGGLVVLAVAKQSVWLGIVSAFILLNCWRGLQQARGLARLAKLPRRPGFACPSCKSAPPVGTFWRCSHCHQPFDTFEKGAVCPTCGAAFDVTLCLDCGEPHALREWVIGGPTPPPLPPARGPT